MNSLLPKSPMNLQQAKTESNLQEFKYSMEYAEQAKTYNQNVEVLDESYKAIKPNHQLIVRCFLIEPKVSETGLVTPFKEVLQVPTQSGVGTHREFETDWPYATKGVVVSTPIQSFKVGDIVQLSPRAVQVALKGAGNNAQVLIANGFMHVDSGLFSPPKDVTSPHYGYILVAPAEIQAVYPKSNMGSSNDFVFTTPDNLGSTFINPSAKLHVNGSGTTVVHSITNSDITIS